MKLLSFTVASSYLSLSTRATLPPGYEDAVSNHNLFLLRIFHNRRFLTDASCRQMYCAPGNCQIYTNPYGYVGAASSFNKCYNPETGETSEGVWTGSLTNVTVPDGWEQPPMCTKEQYSQCDTNDQCTLLISPGCDCYVSSSIHPYQACEGNDCNLSGCTGNECGGYVGVCQPGYNGTGNTCMIESTDAEGATTVPVPTPAPSAATRLSVAIKVLLISSSGAAIYYIA